MIFFSAHLKLSSHRWDAKLHTCLDKSPYTSYLSKDQAQSNNRNPHQNDKISQSIKTTYPRGLLAGTLDMYTTVTELLDPLTNGALVRFETMNLTLHDIHYMNLMNVGFLLT